VAELALRAGLHRNTVQQYLSGKSMLSPGFEKLLKVLSLTPGEILVRDSEVDQVESWAVIADLVDRLHEKFPNYTFLLFGSRARKKAQRYSDVDLGVLSSEKISHRDFLKVYGALKDLAEELPFFVDLVNLTFTQENFLKNILVESQFLCGKLSDYIQFKKRALA
jgi:predicted nucleotidyltransferase